MLDPARGPDLRRLGCDIRGGRVSKVLERKQARDWPDDRLVELARGEAGEASRQAAGELLGRYQERVYRWCYGRLRNHETALDLSQDVLVSAYRSLDSFDGRARFSSWLFAIARNRCLNALRRPALFEEDVDLEAMPDGGQGQDSELAAYEDEEKLLGLIAKALPPLDRQVLWMRCVEKMPVDNITRLLDIPETSGARAVLQRARRRLRAALAAEEGGEARV
jgi:RNA polymerase sigma-70 factor (ECF subfamily)